MLARSAKTTSVIAAVAVWSLHVGDSRADCVLRDAARTVFYFHPNATRDVLLSRDFEEIKQPLGSRLPLPLHHAELGEQALHVVYEDRFPVGLVHGRPEPGRWGLAQISDVLLAVVPPDGTP